MMQLRNCSLLSLIKSPRNINLLIAGGCVCLLAIALYMEHQMQLEPCPLCIMQRVMVLVILILAVIASLHNPQGVGLKVYAGLTMMAAGIGGGLASRQLWLQNLPADQAPACGVGLEYMLDVFPLTEVVRMVLTGDGTCAEVLWTFLGLSIPGWTLIGFIGLLALGVIQLLRPCSVSSD